MNTPFLISGKERPTSPTNPNPTRYQFLSLRDAEPNLAAPTLLTGPVSETYLLVSTISGVRGWGSSFNYDSSFTTLQVNSGFWVSTYVTVQGASGNWESTYNTVFANSGTWLTEASANALYFKLSGGTIFGDARVEGDLVVVGVLSALGGIATTDTRVVETTALRIVNTGVGPALYVEQAGFDDITQFVDTEGGIALHIGNIAPLVPGMNTGVIGIRTEFPNETLTVKGTISASDHIYTTGQYYSAGVNLDDIIYNAVPGILRSTYSTVSSNSAKWESVYNSWFSTSARYTTVDYLSTRELILSAATVRGDVRIFGNLFASGSSFLSNTIITTTSALSVVNDDKGPALYVKQGGAGAVIAEFYDSELTRAPVLHLGNAANPDLFEPPGIVGIRTSNPNKTFTVVGEISSTGLYNEVRLFGERNNLIAGQNMPVLGQLGGLNNVFVGSEIGNFIGFASNNVLLGFQAGRLIFDGNENVFIGSEAGRSATNVSKNIFIGRQSGMLQNNGVGNVFIGEGAGKNNTSGSYNVTIGSQTGAGLQGGSYNIQIGPNTQTVSEVSRQNTLVIGREARATQDDQFVIGSPVYRYNTSRVHADLNVYGTLSATNTQVAGFTAYNTSNFKSDVSFNKNVVVEGTLLAFNINGSVSGTSTGSVNISGMLTVSNGISTNSISARDIVGYYSVLPYQSFSANGIQTDFILLSAAKSVNDIMVFISGVYQSKDFFTLPTQNTLRMSTPPPAGTTLEVTYQKPSEIPWTNVPLPGIGGVQTSMIANRAVDQSKINFDAVQTEHVLDRNITHIKLSNGAPLWDTSNNLTVSGNLIMTDGNVDARNIIPRTTNAFDLGTTSFRWRNIYTQDLHLSNSIGDYTVIEGEDNLYLVNNKKNKTYKFALIEVDPKEVPPRSNIS